MKTARPGMGRRRAFTLVELLVVLAILGVLAALLLPALAKARERAETLRCLSNLKQVSLAALVYAEDNEGCFPAGSPVRANSLGLPTAWVGQLLPFLSASASAPPRTYVCPADSTFKRPALAFGCSYAGNGHVFRITNSADFEEPLRLEQVRHPSDLLLFGEKSARSAEFSQTAADWNEKRLLWNQPLTGTEFRYEGLIRHRGGMMSAAADGRATRLTLPRFTPGAPPPDDLKDLGDVWRNGGFWKSTRTVLNIREVETPGGF